MIRQKFIAICQEALRADEAAGHMNCRVLEPYFRKLIDLANPDGDNRELKDCFRSIVRNEIEAPYDTLGYCMRALRYQEVVEESKRRLGDPPDPRWMNTHSHILHALQDDEWEDSEMWLLQS
jgi:hypothetical protein